MSAFIEHVFISHLERLTHALCVNGYENETIEITISDKLFDDTIIEFHNHPFRFLPGEEIPIKDIKKYKMNFSTGDLIIKRRS